MRTLSVFFSGVCFCWFLLMSCGGDRSNDDGDRGVVAPLTLVNPEEVNEASRQLIGYLGLENRLRQRLAHEPKNFYLNFYLHGYGYSYVDDLSALMGIHEGKGQTSAFRNGTPTPINLLLYELVAIELANDLVRHCLLPVPNAPLAPKYRQSVIDAVTNLCASEKPGAEATAALYRLLNGYANPETDLEEWQRYFLNDYVASSPSTRTRDMVFAAIFNPYTLLTN